MVVAVSQQLGNLDLMATDHCENRLKTRMVQFRADLGNNLSIVK